MMPDRATSSAVSPENVAQSGSFGARLIAAMDRRGPLAVGIDPHPELLAAWDLGADARGLATFADICVDAFGGQAAVIKPQSAFFERFGAAGIAALERTIARCGESGALVLLDVKRGDIGSTMTAYADAYLHPGSPLGADAITVSPYLGVAALEPAFRAAHHHGAGVFVLALTSNPEGHQVQHATGADGRAVAQSVIDELARRNAGARPVGSLGVVVGATIGDLTIELGGLNGPFLVPGIGAQGGTADDVRRVFAGCLRTVLPSVSRSVLRHGPDPRALRDAVGRLQEQFAFLRA